MQPASRFDFGSAEMIPSAQLLDGDSKSIGDCYEGVAAPDSIKRGGP